jgi:hypothetical protein
LRSEGSQFEANLGQKVSKMLSQGIIQAWWCMSIIPAMQEAEVGELWAWTNKANLARVIAKVEECLCTTEQGPEFQHY